MRDVAFRVHLFFVVMTQRLGELVYMLLSVCHGFLSS